MSDEEGNFWIIGVVLVILGSIGSNLGNNLVSLGHKETEISKRKVLPLDTTTDSSRNESLDHRLSNITENNRQSDSGCCQVTKSEVEPSQSQSATLRNVQSTDPSINHHTSKVKFSCSPRLIGTTIFIIGNLFNFAAFGFAAQSLLASLESIQFVSNILFVRYVHKEEITKRMMYSTCSIVFGNVLVVIFSDHNALLLTGADITEIYASNSSYHAYLVIMFVIFCTSSYIYRKYNFARLSLKKSLFGHFVIEPLCFSISSTVMGTQAVLHSKCMAMLIQTTSRGIRNEFLYPVIWVGLVLWLSFVAFWLRRTDLGLALYPPLFIIPVMQVFFTIFAIVCGGLFFSEFVTFGPEKFAGFISGLLLILFGVYGLAPQDSNAKVEHDPNNEANAAEMTEDNIMGKSCDHVDLGLNHDDDHNHGHIHTHAHGHIHVHGHPHSHAQQAIPYFPLVSLLSHNSVGSHESNTGHTLI